MTFVEGPVRVTVPATSANLGPGYDALGLALELRDELTAEVNDRSLAIEVTGEGAADVARDRTHLVARAMDAGFGLMEVSTPPVTLRCHNRIPHARGLGSSAAAIVGGIWLARSLVTDGADRLDLGQALALAHALEGHPDNVAPALYGGFVISGHDDDDVWADGARVHRAVRAIAFVPPYEMATEAARGLLPATVPHSDAAADAGRTALLVAALADAPQRLHRATEDFLHQSYRRPAMPESMDLVDRLRGDGHAAVVSGAGPTVLVLATGHADLSSYTPAGWAQLSLPVAKDGVRLR